MAQGRRVERVAALIRKETSELLINGIRDERVHQGMVSTLAERVAGHCSSKAGISRWAVITLLIPS